MLFSFNRHKTPKTIPTAWEELTLQQSFDLEGLIDRLEMYSIITKIPLKELDALKGDEMAVYSATQFLTNPPDWAKLPKPKAVFINGKRCRIPKIAKETLGQKVIISSLIASEKDLHVLIPKIVAVYLQPVYSGGKFDRDKLKEVEKYLLDSSCVEVYAAAWFFFLKSINLKKFGILGWHQANPTKSPN